MSFLFLAVYVIINTVTVICKRITFASIGLGTFGQKIAEVAINDYDMQCVGAFTRSSNIGRDVSSIIGLSFPTNISIQSIQNLESFLSSVTPDIIFQATRSTVDETFDQIKLSLSHGSNVITLAEELWYPWTTSPEKSKMLDTLAKSKGLSIIGTGGQDVAANKLLVPLLNSVRGIKEIHTNYDFNAQHPCYWKYAEQTLSGIGLNPTECQEFITSAPAINQLKKIFIQPIVERVVVNILGLEYDAKSDLLTECEMRTGINEKDTYLCLACSDKNKTVKIEYPNCIGGECTTIIHTKTGVTVSGTLRWGLFHHIEGWNVDWTVSGKYNSEKLTLYDLDDVPITAIAAVSRVQEALERKGLITELDAIQTWKQCKT